MQKKNAHNTLRAARKPLALYCCEALGLAIFMASACLFGAMLEGNTIWNRAMPDAAERLALTGVLMGCTALLIFYSPLTAPTGAHINPAVTIAFLRLGKISVTNALCYILFQFVGGTLAVYGMAYLLGDVLIDAPVNYAVTVPMKSLPAVFITEFLIAFVMMTMVLNTSAHQRLKKYTRVFSACFVCMYVMVAGPVSGFGMNPARSFASALPANTWTAFWIYAVVPVTGMLLAAEVYLRMERRRMRKRNYKALVRYLDYETPLKETV